MKDDDDTLCYRSELEAAVKAAVEAEREAILQMSATTWFKTQADYDAAIRARGEASINDAYDIARAIEAAHGIKENT